MKSKIAKAVIAVFTVVLTACTSIPVSEYRYAHLDPEFTIPNIPFFPQIEDQCGPSSLATILVTQGIDITPQALKGKIYIPGKEGTVTTEIIARSRQFGLLTYVLEPELGDILTEVNASHPVLVMQNLGLDWLPRWHFSVVMGYDLNKQTIILRSGYDYRHEIGLGLFMKTWQRANSWAIVATSPDKLPATAAPIKTVKAAVELEQVGQIQSASTTYKTVLKRWSNNSTALFGAGNTSYALADYSDAEYYFLQYVAQEPFAAEGWNNLAYSLIELNCTDQAKKAVNCAKQIDSTNSAIHDSFVEINQLQDITTAQQCPAIKCPAQ